MGKVISYNELMKELEKFRSIASRDYELTKEQKKFLLKAREGNHKVSWDNIVVLWKKAGWGKVSRGFIIKQYEKLKDA